jgi:hypothetical protein
MVKTLLELLVDNIIELVCGSAKAVIVNTEDYSIELKDDPSTKIADLITEYVRDVYE